MVMMKIYPPSPQESINQRDYIRTRRKTEIACKLRRWFDKNDSKESSITYIYNPSPHEYKLKRLQSPYFETLLALQPLKNTPPFTKN